MISDLPKEFPLAALSQMDLGVAEARDDALLLKCATPLPMFQEITSGKKDIIHGYRGSGKSSIVRLLAEKALSFDVETGFTNHVLVIDEELEYRSIRDYLSRQTEKGTSPTLLLRVVWDVLICYRSMKYIQEVLGDADATLRENVNDIEVLFGVSKRKVGFVELILTHKKKVGVKLDSNLPSIVDLYAGLEPTTPSSEPENISVLKLVEHIKYLVKLLREKKLTLHVLLDRLDDFVVQEEYDTQRSLLQQLLACQADYRSKYGQGRLKIITFLRTDLFARIDQQPLGPDKVAQRSLEIRWTQSDIRRFVAKRIALNLLRSLKKESLELQFDAARCWITREEIGKLEESKTTLQNFDVFKKSHWEKLFWLWKVVRRRNQAHTRISSFDDAYNEAIITSLLPRVVKHLTLRGELREIPLFDFLDTHFQLGFGQCTPRAILLYLSEVLRASTEYYAANPDLRVLQNSYKEFELFKRESLIIAYANFQRSMWDIQLQIAGPFRPLMMQLNAFRTREAFTFRAFSAAAKTPEDDAKQFLGFCSHTGLLQCTNSNARAIDREYKVPLVYQIVQQAKARAA